MYKKNLSPKNFKKYFIIIIIIIIMIILLIILFYFIFQKKKKIAISHSENFANIGKFLLCQIFAIIAKFCYDSEILL